MSRTEQFSVSAMGMRSHWEHVYSTRQTEALGWYTPQLQTSLSWITALRLPADAPIIDIGGGASTLVDDLLDAGYRALTVLDISATALAVVKARLGEKSGRVTWVHADILSAELPVAHFALWHDRAVLHFLTEPDQQRQYRDALVGALQPGGHVIVGAFSPEAPPKCSGLPVRRYTPELLNETLGMDFELQAHVKELHVTPGGVEQMYVYCRFQLRKV